MRFEVTEVSPQSVAIVRREVPMAEMAGFFDSAFGIVASAVGAVGGAVVGAPFGWYHGTPGATMDVAAGFPIDGIVEGELDDDVTVVVRPGGRAVAAMHVGPFDELQGTYSAVEVEMAERGLEARDDMWEEYLTDPDDQVDASLWETRLVFPLKADEPEDVDDPEV